MIALPNKRDAEAVFGPLGASNLPLLLVRFRLRTFGGNKEE